MAGEREDGIGWTARMCPVCGGRSVVYRSEEAKGGSIRRKRVCRACGTKFETEEKFSRVLYMARQNEKSVLS